MSFLTRLANLLGLSSPAPVTPPGAALAAIVTVPASLGFIPVAIHFDLFNILVGHGGPATADEVSATCNARIKAQAGGEPELSTRLASDTLYIMAGLGLVDRVAEDCFTANAITNHMVAMPSAQHGALHFTTEGLMAGAFLMKKLQDTRFAYPFADADGPLQYAYRLMGQPDLAKKHTYSIMESQGRMDSFNHFMVGKFLKFGTFPERVKSMGYDLDDALAGGTATSSRSSSTTMVDIGGGRGELLLEVQAAYPHLGAEDLIVQEFNADIDNVPGLHFMEWNYKDAEQPVRGACVYALQHILHNLPDLDAVALLQKISRAMTSDSRVLIIEEEFGGVEADSGFVWIGSDF
ncbi:O-methyltransferase, family 2 [Penicillium griseofulvum]|uniref:O-methyltransferase, family 2 n=1 Tax=Penicillium patulum TaxID=5078 RepID=A0A135LRU7_PENPA|nr:O-methyltransferase, family 2 [Penicillium griseofulvum]KXG51695.1 O-methyltransferase, family 2 [Penicillium griseofulvum]